MTNEEFEEHIKRTDRVPAEVFVFKNGMVAVTDQFGQQMPGLQGKWVDKEADIAAASTFDTKWNGI